MHPSERELYKAWDTQAFDVQVALHELLGYTFSPCPCSKSLTQSLCRHGSGKLLQENADGSFKYAESFQSSRGVKD